MIVKERSVRSSGGGESNGTKGSQASLRGLSQTANIYLSVYLEFHDFKGS